MEDILSRNGSGDQVCDNSRAEVEQRPEDQLATARVLLGMALDDPIPTGPLGPDTVPSSVLDLPITMAIEGLIKHAKRCRHRMHCPEYPPPLHVYRRMRPDKLREARDKFNAVLWQHAHHGLVTRVRQGVLKKYPEIAAALARGDLLRSERLSDIVSALGKNASSVLAAVLWATGFAAPGTEDLFRLLVPLVVARRERKLDSHNGGEDSQVTTLRQANRDLKRRRKEAQQIAHEAQEILRARETALAAARHELDDVRRASREATAKADTLEIRAETLARQLQDALATYDCLEREANELTRANNEQRRELQHSQQDRRAFEVQRAELARETAELRRQLEQQKLKLLGIPVGTDAVWNFLQAEEERLDTERLITSGGARERADEAWALYRKLKQGFLAAYPNYSAPRPVKLVPKAPLRLVTLGGSAEIGRSCYLLELGEHRILVDCGIKPGVTDEWHPAINWIERLDALILTHAHTDHIGWVPALMRRFPELEIYCSAATAALLPVMLDDCRKHYMRALAAANERARYSRDPALLTEEYDEGDMHRVSRRAIICDFDTRAMLPFGGVSLQFYRAGHILGAASVLVEDESGRRVLFSGDFSSFSQLTVPAAQWPDDLGSIDLLVLESTYGGRTHPSFEESRNDLLSFIRETTERGGSVILASFALGRAQELLKLLLLAREYSNLPARIPIYVDGMINRINPIYEKFGTVALSLNEFNDISGDAERREVVATAQRIPSIIVSTSGMLTGGPAVEYAHQLLPDHRHRIVFTGYQDEGAPSRILLDLTDGTGSRNVRIEEEDGELREFTAAKPAKLVQLSSHADQPGLLEYSRRLNAKYIALVHGNPSGQEELRKRLMEMHPASEIVSGPPELVVP